MKTKILCSLLAVLFTLAIVLTGCDKAPETTSDHKTTAATTALTTTATTASTSTSEKPTTTTTVTTTTAAPTTTLVITSGSDVIVVYPPSPPVVEGGGEPEGPIVQTVADKNPIAVLSSFFEIDLPKDAKVLEYEHHTEYYEGGDSTQSHIYAARLCISQEQLQHIQDSLAERYYSYIKDDEDSEESFASMERGAQDFNMTGTYYSYPWQISAEDVLDFLYAYRPVQIKMEDYFIATDEHMYILITKEDGQYYLYFDGTGCTAK